jgi:hypothetical protein
MACEPLPFLKPSPASAHFFAVHGCLFVGVDARGLKGGQFLADDLADAFFGGFSGHQRTTLAR